MYVYVTKNVAIFSLMFDKYFFNTKEFNFNFMHSEKEYYNSSLSHVVKIIF